VKRTLGQFTPAQWDKDQWYPLLGPWRFVQVISLCVIFMTVELNTFFLKFCLWIPPRNPLIIYRLILWWLVAIPTIREYNTYLQDRYAVCFFFFFFFSLFPRKDVILHLKKKSKTQLLLLMKTKFFLFILVLVFLGCRPWYWFAAGYLQI
jgi:Phosphatidyl serine synthase